MIENKGFKNYNIFFLVDSKKLKSKIKKIIHHFNFETMQGILILFKNKINYKKNKKFNNYDVFS